MHHANLLALTAGEATMDATVSAALVGAIAGLVGSIPAILISLRTPKFAEKQYEDSTRVDRRVRERVEEMLSHANWESRSFDTISGTMRGIPHDDLRRALIAAGAVSFESDDGKEMWTNRKRALKSIQHIKPAILTEKMRRSL